MANHCIFRCGFPFRNTTKIVLKRKLKRWKWNFTHNEQTELQNQETDHSALVDRMNQIAFENYQIQPWNREIHLFRAKEQRFFLEDFENLKEFFDLLNRLD